MKKCYNCGTMFDSNNSLCPNCGAVNNEDVPVSLNQDNHYQNETPVQSKKNNSVLITLIISASVIVVAIVIAVAVVLLAKDKKPTSNTETQVYEYTSSSTSTTQPSSAATEPQTVIVYNYYDTPATTQYQAPVYNYTSSDYIYPSDTTLLTTEYLSTKSSEEIDLITNEIYARHGYIFKMAKYQNYFGQKSWYHGTEPSMDVVAKRFNSIEQQNINIITKYRNSH